MATRLILGTNFFALSLQRMTIGRGAVKLRRMRFLFLTELRAILPIFRSFFQRIIELQSVILFTLFMWIPT